jgi:hypothetical protein
LQGIVKAFVDLLRHPGLVYPMSPPQDVPSSGERYTSEKELIICQRVQRQEVHERYMMNKLSRIANFQSPYKMRFL